MAQAIPTLRGKVGDFHKQPTRITQLYYERILKKIYDSKKCITLL